jgi:hypothetical protein
MRRPLGPLRTRAFASARFTGRSGKATSAQAACTIRVDDRCECIHDSHAASHTHLACALPMDNVVQSCSEFAAGRVLGIAHGTERHSCGERSCQATEARYTRPLAVSDGPLKAKTFADAHAHPIQVVALFQVVAALNNARANASASSASLIVGPLPVWDVTNEARPFLQSRRRRPTPTPLDISKRGCRAVR